jgi:hypothetical protein
MLDSSSAVYWQRFQSDACPVKKPPDMLRRCGLEGETNSANAIHEIPMTGAGNLQQY